MNMWLMRLGSDMAIWGILELTRVDTVNKVSSGQLEHFQSCSSAAIQLIQQKIEGPWAFCREGEELVLRNSQSVSPLTLFLKRGKRLFLRYS